MYCAVSANVESRIAYNEEPRDDTDGAEADAPNDKSQHSKYGSETILIGRESVRIHN